MSDESWELNRAPVEADSVCLNYGRLLAEFNAVSRSKESARGIKNKLHIITALTLLMSSNSCPRSPADRLVTSASMVERSISTANSILC